MRPRPLPLAFYARDTVTVAQELLGQLLVSTVGGARCVGRIVETEAYIGPDDPASHAARWRRTPRNEIMYGEPGLLYVYFTYGMHWCVNVVTERAGFPAAVLLRAVQPLAGLEAMRRRRGGVRDRQLAAGPARLAQALGIGQRLNGHPLTAPPVVIAPGESVPPEWRRSAPRVGVREAASWRLRFYERGNPFVSQPSTGVRR